jgi:DNA (cytosine-5)-methyltransferase 1
MKYLDLFTGIGGFTYGIEKAFCNAHGGAVGGSKTNPSRDEGQGLLTKEGEDSGTEERPTGECTANVAHKRPLCVGYSEIDKYASAIYQSHYPTHHNYGDITKIDATTLPDFDLLVGGFPCQAFSIAGKRLGFDDTRGTLFFEVARILKEKQPRNFVLENVKGLLSHDGGRTFKTIISTLAELGYGVEWQVLNSKDFGVPQNRERVYIVGHLGGLTEPKVFPIGGDGEETNAIHQLNQPKHSNDRVYSADGISPTLNTMQGVNRQPFIVGGLQKHQTVREDGISPCLTTAMGQGGGQTPIVWGEEIKIRRLTPTECERLQGFPDGWTASVSDTQRYKCLGNAVTTNVVEAVIRKLYS